MCRNMGCRLCPSQVYWDSRQRRLLLLGAGVGCGGSSWCHSASDSGGGGDGGKLYLHVDNHKKGGKKIIA